MTVERETYKAAKAYWIAGLSVLPVKPDGRKRPNSKLLPFQGDDGAKSWKPLATRLASAGEIERMFAADKPNGIGLIGGNVSGGLEVFDFESQEAWEHFRELVDDFSPGLLERQPQVRTPRDGGGHHLYVWSDAAGPSQKLAASVNGTLLIEIKSESGYVLAPGSHQRCHPTGRAYQHVADTPPITSKPRVTEDEREILLSCARSLNECVPQSTENGVPSEPKHPDSPGSIYSRVETFETAGLLEKHGWTRGKQIGDRWEWKRPGKETPGVSAMSGCKDRHGRDVLNVYSTAASPLRPDFTDADGNHHATGKPYTLFAAKAALEHGGDFSKAASDLARQDYTADSYPEFARLFDRPANGSELRTWVPFPVDALPEPFCQYVNGVSKCLPCDPAMVITPLLSAVAGVIGNSNRIQLRSDWEEPSVIWATHLADSGSMKSPATDNAVAPVQELQQQAFQEYGQELQEYKEQLRLLKANKGEGGESPPDKPICKRFIVTDTTVEALVERLQENPRGLLLASDELAAWLLAMNQYKGGRGADVQHWLSMHGARPLTFDRKGQEPTYVSLAAVSVCGPMPPEVFKRVMAREHTENGMLPRLLVTMPPKIRKRWGVPPSDPNIFRSVKGVFRALADLEPENDHPRRVTLGKEAEELFASWYDEHAARQEEADPLLASAYSKLEAYAGRFALVFHLVRYVQGDTGEEVDAESMQSALVIADWFVYETTRVYTILQADHETQRALAVADLVRKLGGSASARDLMRHANRYKTAEEATEDLDLLSKRKWGEWVNSQGKRGRPSRLMRLIDNIDKTGRNGRRGEVLSILSMPSIGVDAEDDQEVEVQL